VAAEPAVGWSRAQRRLHWSTVALVVATAALAPVMVALPFRLLLEKFLAYQLHKSFGLLVPVLLAARLLLRARRGRPAPDAGIAAWQRRAAATVHGVLYALLLVVPTLGLLTAASAPGGMPTLLFLLIPIPHPIGPDEARFALLRLLHIGMALLLLALAAGHALMAVAHHREGRPVLRAMWRG
jgi:cytochrome b561